MKKTLIFISFVICVMLSHKVKAEAAETNNSFAFNNYESALKVTVIKESTDNLEESTYIGEKRMTSKSKKLIYRANLVENVFTTMGTLKKGDWNLFVKDSARTQIKANILNGDVNNNVYCSVILYWTDKSGVSRSKSDTGDMDNLSGTYSGPWVKASTDSSSCYSYHYGKTTDYSYYSTVYDAGFYLYESDIN